MNWRTIGSALRLRAGRLVHFGAVFAALSVPVLSSTPSRAEGETRSLKIYYVHTGEKAVITFKRNGKYDPQGLEKLNLILRDWRKNQPTKMDPHLFDLIWEVYRQTGSHEFINVICGFRSPGTNEMLRTRSAHTGVAKKSQHMLGKAMDFYIPGVNLEKLREIGMKLQAGGVGYYPTSGSPFVHMDVGGVRAWPRMDRQNLVRLFPDGKTMHIPTDGKPLPGYEEAVASYKKRIASDSVEFASASPSSHRGFLARLFGIGGGADEEEDNADEGAAPATGTASKPAPAAPTAAPAQPEIAVASLNAPVPLVRPSFAVAPESGMVAALVSPEASTPAQAALAAAAPQPQFVDLKSYTVPVPALLASRRGPETTEVASIDPDSPVLTVPVPLERPEVAEKLLASASADPEARVDQADVALAPPPQPAPDSNSRLTPAVVAALAQQRPEETAMSPAAVRAINAVSPRQQAPQPKVVQMAALAPVPGPKRFNDGFDMPQAVVADGASAPAKGSRPTPAEAVSASAAHSARRTQPTVNAKMFAKGTLTVDRMAAVAKPVTAPKFVSETLRTPPTTVYAQGFTKTASIEADRFSGSAVNFLQVKKFNSIQ